MGLFVFVAIATLVGLLLKWDCQGLEDRQPEDYY